MAILNLNLSDVSADTNFDPIPEGEYSVKVTDTKVYVSKAGNQCIQAVFDVTGPQFAGRKIYENYAIGNEVGRRIFKGMLTAGGHPSPDFINDSEEAHGLEMLAKVVIEEDESGKYEPQNKIKKYKKLANSKPFAQPKKQPQPTVNPAVAVQHTQPTSTGSEMPWD